MSALTLKIISPEGASQIVGCDSVTLWMAPDVNGKGEGSIGIRKGHTDAVIALGSGPVHAHLDGNEVFSAKSEGGFATVLHDTVTIVTPKIMRNEK